MKQFPKVKALIFMKINSERVPKKNIKNLYGKPLFHWVLKSLSNSKYINEENGVPFGKYSPRYYPVGIFKLC